MHAQECQYTRGSLCLLTVSVSNNDLLFPTRAWVNTNVWHSSLYMYSIQPSFGFTFILLLVLLLLLSENENCWFAPRCDCSMKEIMTDELLRQLNVQINQERYTHTGKSNHYQRKVCRSLQPAISIKNALLTGWLKKKKRKKDAFPLKEKMSICSCVINTLWWAFGGKRKNKTLITPSSFVCNWQVMMTFMFMLHHIILLLTLTIWGVSTANLRGSLLCCVIAYVSSCFVLFFVYCPDAIPYAPSRFPPEWLPVRPPWFVSSRLSRLISNFSTVLSGNYEVTTAAPNRTLFFGAWQNLKTQLKITKFTKQVPKLESAAKTH